MAGQMVSFPTPAGDAEGYLAAPDTPGPGVLVIQEWWGLVGHIRAVADRFAAAGFTALAPDLFHGEQTTSPDAAGKLLMALDVERAARDLRGAGDRLASAASGNRLGVVGFCMGGQLALYAAGGSDRIGACVDFYGIHPNVHPDYASIQCPVLGLFAEHDDFVPAQAVSALREKLMEAGVETHFHTYDGAQHAFFNDERPSYHQPSATDAWTRVLGFLRKNLD